MDLGAHGAPGRSGDHGVLRLTFADLLAGSVDALDRMGAPVFERVRTPAGFAEARPERASGTVTWPGGADLASGPLHERRRRGAWPGQDAAA